jgi:hypothetical protein
MARRSRKSRPAGAPPPPRPPRRSNAERDEEARSSLEPLAPGERPYWVTVAAIVATVLALITLILIATGYEVSGSNTVGAGLGQAGILLLAAAGMWRGRYWAVLGFEALLGITAVIGFLSLLVASNVWGAVLALIVVGASGFLFTKLVRAMARIQMPRRPRE